MIQRLSKEDADKVFTELIAPSGYKLSPENYAISRLEVGEAITFPCRWTHSIKGGYCIMRAYVTGNGRNWDKTFQTVCKDKVFYVRRIK